MMIVRSLQSYCGSWANCLGLVALSKCNERTVPTLVLQPCLQLGFKR